ncbi:NLI interacting factor-like phosphatase [Carpediemonas membranifera]|uniref:NLI interacting factor-like phosphatase n=1 Tax=Carpediemonas membranifera TaxID=201153 RepID=A0A8J6ATM7_9EUKA|nr:NLI interacting factor-like phosphatase [Carpediemonas membranifera]|eukprot:KAG9392105.1 NLI interacting factor-like phosphatase [Carpediemonas membranifera]
MVTRGHVTTAVAIGVAAGYFSFNAYHPDKREVLKDHVRGIREAKQFLTPSSLHRLASILTESRSQLAPATLPTLIIDMDSVLIGKHLQRGVKTLGLRPGAAEFIDALTGRYDVVLYTSYPAAMAKNIVTGIDPAGKVVTRTIDKHPSLKRGRWWSRKVVSPKFLNGRDDVTLLSASRGSGWFVPTQNIVIPAWKDATRDTALFELAESLESGLLSIGAVDPVAADSGLMSEADGIRRVMYGDEEPRDPLAWQILRKHRR